MIEQNGSSVLKKEKYSPSLSQFQNFDDALDELTRKLYDREYYNIPNSFVSVLYNLELHRFQTIASSSSFHDSGVYTRTDDRNLKSTITIVRVKTNQKEFDDYIESVINKHTYTLEDLAKDEYRRLIIDYIVHLQIEKVFLNPLQIAANHEIQTYDVRRLISKLQYTQQKGHDIAPLLTAMYDIPPGIARLVERNMHVDQPQSHSLLSQP
jgi:hypothetical protein